MDDILDIDELTKDDSFFSLDDKDVCNIIQQWKNKQQQQQQKQAAAQQQFHAQQQTQIQNNDNVYRVNSRTFTRPKRKSAAQNLESQFNGITEQQQQQCQSPQYPLTLDTKIATPMLNVQIGGKIRTPLSARSMLHDTSPPSYMDASLGSSPMDNSLVTSADFTNIDFLLSTPSLDASAYAEKYNNGAVQPQYTLNDMICDRKALESLTLSGDDGALIKDSQIAQFDDISLALCKASCSGSSTMGNSTESVEGNSSGGGYGVGDGGGSGNETVIMLAAGDNSNNSKNFDFNNRTLDAVNVTYTSGNGTGQSNTLQQTMVLSNEEMISDTTFSLIENGQSFIIERDVEANADTGSAAMAQLNQTHDVMATLDNNTSPNREAGWNETVCLQNCNNNNNYNENENYEKQSVQADTTFDCELPNLPGTPEEFRRPMKPISTPHNTARYNNANTYLPSVNMIREDLNISPIVSASELTTTRLKSSAGLSSAAEPWNTTFDMNKETAPPSTASNDTYVGSPLSHLHDQMEMLENIEMPHPSETPNQRRRSRTRLLSMEYELNQQEQQHQEQLDLEQARLNKSTIEMQDVMDLVEAEAELLATVDHGLDDEVHFEHMLDKLGRVELNAEQLKMKKSVETIKKRFNCTLNGGVSEQETRSEANCSSKTFTSETREEALRHLRDEMSRNRFNDNNNINTTTSTLHSSRELGSSALSTASNTSMGASSGGSSGAERLLSRRSRLYDDINLSTLSCASQQDIATESTSKMNTNIAPVVQTTKVATTATKTMETTAMNEKTEGGESIDAAKYKLAEKRERDRDRFKTMKIVKNPNNDGDGSSSGSGANQNELNVPCIDGGEMDSETIATENSMPQQQRFSRRDLNNADAISGGASVASPRTVASKLQSNTNFLTYKKPKQQQQLNRPEVIDFDHNTRIAVAPKLSNEVRSLSRPRYISGLQKCSVVSKAVSAGDLEKTEQNTAADPSTRFGEGKTAQLSSRMYANGRKYFNNENNCGRGGVTTHAAAVSGQTAMGTKAAGKSELKSPMGIKAKSLHNLSSNLNYTALNTGIAAPSRIGSYGLRKINSGGINAASAEQQNQLHDQPLQKNSSNLARTQKSAGGSLQSQNNQATFKKPQRVGGLKSTTTGATGTRTAASIARPSSGYYSLNTVNKTIVQTLNSDDIKPNRSITSLNDGKSVNNIAAVIDEPNQLTRITVGATGIPKPSGLRAPTKRSGLPVPSSGVRR